MSQIPEGATHVSAGHYYKKEGASWMLYGSASQWMETACLWKWLDENAEPLIPEWTGSGLPPVGADIEIHEGPASWDDQKKWLGLRAKVIHVFKNQLDQNIATVEAGNGECACFIVECLRPIRTPEQVEQEISYKAICQLMDDLDIPSAIAARAYDLGYRKFEIVQGDK